jgi:hypothetical protein
MMHDGSCLVRREASNQSAGTEVLGALTPFLSVLAWLLKGHERSRLAGKWIGARLTVLD